MSGGRDELLYASYRYPNPSLDRVVGISTIGARVVVEVNGWFVVVLGFVVVVDWVEVKVVDVVIDVAEVEVNSVGGGVVVVVCSVNEDKSVKNSVVCEDGSSSVVVVCSSVVCSSVVDISSSSVEVEDSATIVVGDD